MREVNIQFLAEYVHRKSPMYSKVAKFAASRNGMGYGEDVSTERVKALIRGKFGCESELIGSGTGTNLTAIGACVSAEKPCVITPNLAHINTLEYGGLERFFGAKLINPRNSQLTLDLNETSKLAQKMDGQVSVVSVTLANERGLTYTTDYLSGLRKICDEYGLILHGDLARGFVAAYSMKMKISRVLSFFDIVSLGTMKMGGPCEILCWKNPKLGEKIRETRKVLGHDYNNTMSDAILLRYILEHEIEENAKRSVVLARTLAQGITGMDISLEWQQATNQVFPRFPEKLSNKLRKKYMYYDDYGSPENRREIVARFVTSPTMTEKSVNRLLQVINDCRKKT